MSDDSVLREFNGWERKIQHLCYSASEQCCVSYTYMVELRRERLCQDATCVRKPKPIQIYAKQRLSRTDNITPKSRQHRI